MNKSYCMSIIASIAIVIAIVMAINTTHKQEDASPYVMENIEALSNTETGSTVKWQTYGCGIFQGARYACTTNKLTTRCVIDCGVPQN